MIYWILEFTMSFLLSRILSRQNLRLFQCLQNIFSGHASEYLSISKSKEESTEVYLLINYKYIKEPRKGKHCFNHVKQTLQPLTDIFSNSPANMKLCLQSIDILTQYLFCRSYCVGTVRFGSTLGADAL